eukprot:gene1112-2162_t
MADKYFQWGDRAYSDYLQSTSCICDNTQMYPKGVTIDFRKLDRHAVERILKHYKGQLLYKQSSNSFFINSIIILVTFDTEAKTNDLACIAARAFESAAFIEFNVIDKVISQMKPAPSAPEPTQSRKRRRDQLDSEHARIGEQVAAKVSRLEENGAWILANVLEYNASTSTYIIQDEDDVARVITLPARDVKRLEDSASHIRKGDRVIAVFPDTTSFYRAAVVKNPKNPTHGNGAWEVVVRFHDDEDESGKTPPRRVPARFVLKHADIDDSVEEDSVSHH